MAEGIVHTASAWEVERADFQAELAKPIVNWNASDTGSFLVILLAGFVAFLPIGKKKGVRRVHQVLLGYLGLVGHVLSQGLFLVGLDGVPGSVHPSLLFFTGCFGANGHWKTIYCHQLCPHGGSAMDAQGT